MMKSRNNQDNIFHCNNLHHDDADALKELEQRFSILPTLGDGDPCDNCEDDQAQDVGRAAREADYQNGNDIQALDICRAGQVGNR